MNKKIPIMIIILIAIVVILFFGYYLKSFKQNATIATNTTQQTQENSSPLQISVMRQKNYPGSQITIEQTLSPGSNYNQYIVSYKSDDLKIYALMTVPVGQKPSAGWPVIIFNHGYIPPAQYQTTQKYVAYVNSLARNGFIVFKPDYRGNGNSQGQPEGAYYSPAYATDVLNALASIKHYPDANPDKIGMWGHSLGGNLTLRAMVVSKDIKAGVIWSGVVGTYDQLLNQWRRGRPWTPSEREITGHVTSIRQNLVDKYGTPQANPQFWQSIDPRYFLEDISGPLELHQGLADEEVPPLFSEGLKNDLEKLGKKVELFTYPGADHNISSPSFELAMQRTIDFFNRYLKGGEK